MGMIMNFVERFGPWALVTGASSGIGKELASLLAARGLNLVITARRRDRLEQLAATLSKAHNVRVEVVEADLTHQDFMEPLLQATMGKDIGLVVSNAGFGFKGLHHNQDRKRLIDLINVNVLAPTLLTNGFAPQLIARGKGGILITGSVEGYFSSPWSAAYAATKAHVHSLGEAIWDELKSHGVQVLVLAPGATDTENLKSQGFDAATMKNVMTAHEVAELALNNMENGPLYVPGTVNKAMVRILGLMPRRMRISAVGKGTKAAMKQS
jgi:uncharacterized protein